MKIAIIVKGTSKVMIDSLIQRGIRNGQITNVEQSFKKQEFTSTCDIIFLDKREEDLADTIITNWFCETLCTEKYNRPDGTLLFHCYKAESTSDVLQLIKKAGEIQNAASQN